MALRYQADTQTKPLGANANTPLQGNTAFKDGQLAEVILLITGRFTVGEGYNGIHKLFQQLRHRFAVEQLPGIKVDPVLFLRRQLAVGGDLSPLAQSRRTACRDRC